MSEVRQKTRIWCMVFALDANSEASWECPICGREHKTGKFVGVVWMEADDTFHAVKDPNGFTCCGEHHTSNVIGTFEECRQFMDATPIKDLERLDLPDDFVRTIRELPLPWLIN